MSLKISDDQSDSDSLSHGPDLLQLNTEQDPFAKMKELRLKNPHNLIISYLNINSVRNKFENFTGMISEYVDVIVLAETKLDDTFPKNQFSLPGFKAPIRLDRTLNSGGLLVLINEKITSKQIKTITVPGDIQAVPIELNINNSRWLLLPIYKPPCQNEAYFLDEIQKVVDFCAKSVQNLLLFGDFNMDTTNNTLSSFIDSNGLFSMIRTPTCFKSTQGRCIDLMLTNKKYSFKATQTFETGFSDFHHLIYAILKSRFTKLPAKTIRYRDYSKYSEEQFLTQLSFNLAKVSPGSIESFTELFDKTLDKHAPFKTVVIRGNNKPHMSKTLRKAIMLRTRLKDRSVKTRNEADFHRYRQQRNLVVKQNKRAKREYYGNLDMNSMKDNKSFWKKLKPLFSNSMVNEKIVLIENEKIIRDDKEISQYLMNILLI